MKLMHFISLMLVSCGLFAETPARVAIIGTPSAADFSAALTAKMSGDPAFGLLERDELDRIASEKGNGNLMEHPENLKVGTLLNAQGLLLLDSVPTNNRAMEVRLIAVDPGVVLFDYAMPALPLKDQIEAVHQQVERALPKLRVRRRDAVALSVLGLRATMETGTSREFERRLNAMLISRLAAVPEFFTLERRKMDALAAEKAFNPGTLGAFWGGAWLVDGSFDPTPAKDGSVTVRVRLRAAVAGTEKTVEASADGNALPQLAEAIAEKIEQALGGKISSASWQLKEEADQYFKECVWATSRGLYSQALESAESALALGDTQADLTGLHAFLLAMRVTPTDETTSLHDKDVPEPLPEAERLDDALRAIDDARRYRDEGMEKRLKFFDTDQDMNFRTGELCRLVLRRTTALLITLTQNGDSERAAELRNAVRNLANFDPGANKLSTDGLLAARFGVYWSKDEAEWLDYWRAVASRKYDHHEFEPPLLADLIQKQAYVLGDRFPLTADQKQQHFDKFVAGLLSNPETETIGWMIRSAGKGPEEERKKLYEKLLDRMWNERETGLRFYWIVFKNPLMAEFPGKYVQIARDFLQHNSGFEEILLPHLLNPNFIPEDQAAVIWQDLESYKARVIAAQANPTTQANLVHYFRLFEDPISKKFPGVVVKQAELPALAVKHFATPYDLADQTEGEFLLRKCQVADHHAWIAGTNTAGQERLLEINLDTCGVTPLPLLPADDGARQFIYQIDVIPGGLVTLGDHLNASSKNRSAAVGRYDCNTRRWTVRTIPLSTPQNAQFLWKGGHLFMTMQGDGGGGLLRYDWDADETAILASGRRKPAQNQFDDRGEYPVRGVFEGPAGKVCAVMDNEIYFVRENPGDWERAVDFDFAQSLAVGGRTLLFNWVGDVMLVDPAKPAPEPWMTRATAVPRPPPDRSKGKWSPRLAAWRDKALWQTPIDWNGNTASADKIGFTRDDLFLLFKTNDNPARFAIHWYWRGGPAGGLVVPLAFEMQQPTLDKIKAKMGREETYGGIKYLTTPERDGMPLRMATAANGLVLEPIRTGIWFIPFVDLNKYREESRTKFAAIQVAGAQAKPRASATGKTKETNGDAIDETEPGYFK